MTWVKCEFHLAFLDRCFDAAHKKHKEMGCICFENEAMGIYFIEDPDGYWLEIFRNIKRGCMLQVNLENLLKVYSLFVVYGVLDAI